MLKERRHDCPNLSKDLVNLAENSIRATAFGRKGLTELNRGIHDGSDKLSLLIWLINATRHELLNGSCPLRNQAFGSECNRIAAPRRAVSAPLTQLISVLRERYNIHFSISSLYGIKKNAVQRPTKIVAHPLFTLVDEGPREV